MIISVEDVGNSNDLITLQFKAAKLDNKDRFSKSDPYLTIYRTNSDGSITIAHRTETIMDSLNPTWRAFTIPLRTLCANDLQRQIYIYCWDWDSNARDEYIGGCEITVNSGFRKDPTSSNVFKLINQSKKEKSSKYDNSGLLSLIECNIDRKYSIVDFIRSGTQIHFTVAIDFNKASMYQSAHETVLASVSGLLDYYNRTKIYRAMGFGAVLDEKGEDKDPDNAGFFLNGPSNPCCKGVEEIIESYRNQLSKTTAFDHVELVPIIKQFESFAKNHGDDDNYFVLLMLTNHHDTMATEKMQDIIIEAAELPLSIIIVGCGNDEFDKPVVKKGLKEDIAACESGKRNINDIAHFVRFEDFMDHETKVVSKDRLAVEVFKKLPDQFVYYMTDVVDTKPRYL